MLQEKSMTDLEITKLCAQAMNLGHIRTDYESGTFMASDENTLTCPNCSEYALAYDPLHDDAQAMALVKKFRIDMTAIAGNRWLVQCYGPPIFEATEQFDLNAAICECVAKMQNAKPLP